MKDVNTVEMIERHEGLRLKPYKCTAGKLTIGYGRNLDDKGISEEEADYLLVNDILEVVGQLQSNLPWYVNLSHNRQAVLIDMCFNLGIQGLLKFKATLSCIVAEDYARAAINMRNSKWAKQVGARATELAKLMEEG